jgi:heptosyltransferase-2/heptosyltransferase-3
MKYFLGLIRRIIHEYEIPVRLDRISRVLVVDPNYIGDMLFSSVVYRALKENLPNARVEALVYPFTKEILSANPFVDHVYDLPKGSLLQQLSILIKLRKTEFDLVLQLNTSLRTNFLMFLICGKYRLGYDYRNRGCLNNIRVRIATRTAQTRYRVDECADLLEQAFAWRVSEREMILHVAAEHKERALQLLAKNKVGASDLLIGIQANCRETWKERRWEQSKFSNLANELIRLYDAKIVFTGSMDDAEYVSSIIRGIQFQGNIVNLVGKTAIMELAAVLRRIDVFITVNTGPMQIAVSQRTPTVVLMGVTPPLVTYPLNVPIFQYVWTGNQDTESQLKVDPKDAMRMKSIEVHHVLEKVAILLQQRTGKTGNKIFSDNESASNRKRE